MKKHSWSVSLAAGCLAALVLGGAALAAGQQGSQSDPLVTLSYLTEKAMPSIMAQVDEKIAQREDALRAQLGQVVSEYVKEVEDKLSGSGGGTAASGASYAVVSLQAGQTLTGAAGCEFLLRSGTAVCVTSSTPGLIDTTDGGTLANGGGLTANHLYLSSSEGQGVRASTAATLLVRGNYTTNA